MKSLNGVRRSCNRLPAILGRNGVSEFPVSASGHKERHLCTDDQLVLLAQYGDEYAFIELYNRYSSSLERTIIRIVRYPEDAEDVLQDTLMRAYGRLRSFRRECAFSSWITRIAINSSLMVLRERRKRAETSFGFIANHREDIDAWEVADSSPNAEQLCVQQERNNILKRRIDRLPKVMRQALEPYCVGNFTLPELADALGISRSAAKSRILRARNTLLRSMKSAADANEMTTECGRSSSKGDANVHHSSSPDN